STSGPHLGHHPGTQLLGPGRLRPGRRLLRPLRLLSHQNTFLSSNEAAARVPAGTTPARSEPPYRSNGPPEAGPLYCWPGCCQIGLGAWALVRGAAASVTAAAASSPQAKSSSAAASSRAPRRRAGAGPDFWNSGSCQYLINRPSAGTH